MKYEEIRNEVVHHRFSPVYFFYGEESYFIDELTGLILSHALSESERDFNQIVLYGIDVTAADIVTAARRYPMMAERQVVVVKEAQNLGDWTSLAYYAEHPLVSTVLVIDYKGPKAPAAAGEILRNGVVFESKRIYENQVPQFVSAYLKRKNVSIDPRSAQIITDHVGANLSTLVNELDKLTVALPSDRRNITPELIENNIGISKDFNVFELRTALANKDALKAYRIVKYFGENPKAGPMPQVLTVLFDFFSDLMICYFQKDRSQANVMRVLKIPFPNFAKDYMAALKNYDAFKTMGIISSIRRCDARSKGVGNPSVSGEDLLKELVFSILH